VLVGLFIGGLLPYFFGSLLMEAVGKSAGGIVEEVRRQFREIPGLLEGKPGVKADYKRCVSIATFAAQRRMIAPALVALIVPPLLGFTLGPAALGGALAGATIVGVSLAIMMANAGGAWDNGKKYIEAAKLVDRQLDQVLAGAEQRRRAAAGSPAPPGRRA